MIHFDGFAAHLLKTPIFWKTFLASASKQNSTKLALRVLLFDHAFMVSAFFISPRSFRDPACLCLYALKGKRTNISSVVLWFQAKYCPSVVCLPSASSAGDARIAGKTNRSSMFIQSWSNHANIWSQTQTTLWYLRAVKTGVLRWGWSAFFPCPNCLFSWIMISVVLLRCVPRHCIAFETDVPIQCIVSGLSKTQDTVPSIQFGRHYQ